MSKRDETISRLLNSAASQIGAAYEAGYRDAQEEYAAEQRARLGAAIRGWTGQIIADQEKRPVGRPRKHPNRKEYRKQWMRRDRRDHPEKYGKPAKKGQAE